MKEPVTYQEQPLVFEHANLRGEESKLTIEEVDYHRNGIGGIGFHIVKFLDHANGPMVAIIFPEPGAVAVFNRDRLKEDDTRFFYNSWRGDVYEPYMREALKDNERRWHETYSKATT